MSPGVCAIINHNLIKMHIPLKIIGSSKLSGGPWNILKPLENNKILLLKANSVGQYPPSYKYGKFSEVSAILPDCLFLNLSQNSQLVVGMLESGHIMVWDTERRVARLVRGQPEFITEKVFEDNNEDVLNVCEDSMNISVATRRHLFTWTPGCNRESIFSAEEKTIPGSWNKSSLPVNYTPIGVHTRYVKRRYAWVTAVLGRKHGENEDGRRDLEVTIVQHDQAGQPAHKTTQLVVQSSSATARPICRLDHEAVLLCVSGGQFTTLVCAETGQIVSSVQTGRDICDITWHLTSSMFFITDCSGYVSVFSRTMNRFYLTLDNDPTFMEHLNSQLIFNTKNEVRDFETSNILIFS